MRAHLKTEKASKVRGELLTNVMGQVQNVLGFFLKKGSGGVKQEEHTQVEKQRHLRDLGF